MTAPWYTEHTAHVSGMTQRQQHYLGLCLGGKGQLICCVTRGREGGKGGVGRVGEEREGRGGEGGEGEG